MEYAGMSRPNTSNKRTALILAAVALALFVAIVLRYSWFK